MSEIIKEKANAARKQLIPIKSSDRYRKEIDSFRDWQRDIKVHNIDEDVILAYVSQLVSSIVCYTDRIHNKRFPFSLRNMSRHQFGQNYRC